MKLVKDGTFTGFRGKNHIQGMAVDEKNGRIYYSFTTKLVVTATDGTPIGSAKGLLGHLGCICFNKEDGLIYGSLEYKHDAIGRGIANKTGNALTFPEGFYAVVFDGLKITREDMDAETDGIMTAAFLSAVTDDYRAAGPGREMHRFGCSGIDGTTIAPEPGQTDGKKYLYVAYGIYRDQKRLDNDCQVIHRYDCDTLKAYAKPLSQTDMHKSGPGEPLSRYFVYTGNTDWGVQNLCYDETRRLMFLAVYPGKKEKFANHGMYAVDMTKPPVSAVPPGCEIREQMLTLYGARDVHDETTPGWDFSFGPYGMPALPDGTFLIAEPGEENGENFARIYNYRFSPENGFIREDIL